MSTNPSNNNNNSSTQNNNAKERSTSELLETVVVVYRSETLTIGEIKNSLHERGFGILLAIAALPLCLPVPVPPGYTTFFSIPLFIFSVQMIIGMQSPWLPLWISKKKIRRASLEKLIVKANPWLKKIEKRLQPRLTYISVHTWERIIGIFAFVFALSISLPIPLTNFPPGWGILIMSLGLLSKDGITILIGMIIGTIGVGITMIILVLLWMGMSLPTFY
ncbi:exopolysaccharide biosynthesis protein [Nitrosomonas sp.]|uniref:exopolysaccharide biosynthesis protein n=1 Tax=Nitrosomonas sp. TaxID=42353 RepID=UPI001E071E01|nr:exopolysaccharide biosynthesis protein [Nitrosomonas sp.]MCB1949869.1 exopolysaccharide biosynthesis protein [Nitrosomonas sp.]MCP5242832.1 exopolysaccharide biosynthesis protein [Burkholderiales bacterium]MDR4514411.1 exopolysaccharide biosynthesis protein [Nitrosomonas sp.]